MVLDARLVRIALVLALVLPAIVRGAENQPGSTPVRNAEKGKTIPHIPSPPATTARGTNQGQPTPPPVPAPTPGITATVPATSLTSRLDTQATPAPVARPAPTTIRQSVPTPTLEDCIAYNAFIKAGGDGCGSATADPWVRSFIPKGVGGQSFKPACDAHDLCYAKQGKTKKECDKALNRNLHEACRKTRTTLQAVGCDLIAEAMSLAVRTRGNPAYTKGQREAKHCPSIVNDKRNSPPGRTPAPRAEPSRSQPVERSKQGSPATGRTPSGNGPVGGTNANRGRDVGGSSHRGSGRSGDSRSGRGRSGGRSGGGRKK